MTLRAFFFCNRQPSDMEKIATSQTVFYVKFAIKESAYRHGLGYPMILLSISGTPLMCRSMAGEGGEYGFGEGCAGREAPALQPRIGFYGP